LQRWIRSLGAFSSVTFAAYIGYAGSALVYGQTAPHREERPEWKAFYASQKSYRGRGTAALAAESALEKKDECKSAMTTYDIGECGSRLFDSTQQNYVSYVRAIGALLRLHTPDEKSPGEESMPDAGRAFDAAEALWIKYRDSQCESGGNLYWGGTMRPGAILGCRIRLTQRHIQDLAEIYADLWS
jgi:uncharacterized protein YecT (DUF1311 family)